MRVDPVVAMSLETRETVETPPVSNNWIDDVYNLLENFVGLSPSFRYVPICYVHLLLHHRCNKYFTRIFTCQIFFSFTVNVVESTFLCELTVKRFSREEDLHKGTFLHSLYNYICDSLCIKLFIIYHFIIMIK